MKLPGIRPRKVAPNAGADGECPAPQQGADRPLLPNLLSRYSSEGGEERAEPENAGRSGGEASRRPGVSREDFEVLSLLGQGGFGEVKLVKCTVNGQMYAMKALEKSAILERRHFGDDGARGRVQAERDIGVLASQWNCPFIIELFATFQTRDKLYFVFDYCPQGDLFERLLEQPNSRFEEATARFYTAEVCVALEHLHTHDAIHRDVKLENMLLASDGHVKLADFGIAKMNLSPEGARPSYAFGEGSSMAFYPPEFRRGEAYGKDLDCWQLGVAAFLMLSGRLPEPDGPVVLKGVSAPAADFCKQLLATDRRRRLGYPSGACQLRRHGFFRGLSWPALEARALAPPGHGAAQPAATEAEPRWGGPVRPTQNLKGQKSGLFRLHRFTFVGSLFSGWGRARSRVSL